MNKEDLSPLDYDLVAAVISEAQKSVLHLDSEVRPPVVSAALRLADGEVITSVNLKADVGCLSICAEPTAIAQAIKQPDNEIEIIVSIYNPKDSEPLVISPCGSCREFITDYTKDAFVILREPKSDKLFKVRASELLPLKYVDYWEGDLLV